MNFSETTKKAEGNQFGELTAQQPYKPQTKYGEKFIDQKEYLKNPNQIKVSLSPEGPSEKSTMPSSNAERTMSLSGS